MTLDADALGDVVLALGRPDFVRHYQAFCHHWLEADDSLAFVLPDRAPPRIVLRSPMQDENDRAGGLYFGGAYKKDGNLRYQGSLAQPVVRLIDADDRRLEPTQRRVYRLGHVVQMVTLVARRGNSLTCLGFYKRDRGRFSGRTIAAIEAARSLLLLPVHRHDQLSLMAEGEGVFRRTGDADHRAADAARIAAVFLATTPLSPREADVCARAMLGYSVPASGLDLGLSANTVKIHRSRGFARLGIATASELFPAYRSALNRLRHPSLG